MTFKNLRLVQSDLVRHYLLRHPELLNRWSWIRPFDLEPRPFLGHDLVLYHSWLPGAIELDPALGEIARQLIAGEATPDAGDGHRQVAAALSDLGWCEDVPVDLDALILKAQDNFSAVQNPNELRAFLELVRERRPRTLLEIGTATGGTFYCLSQLADPSALLISMDFLGGNYGGGQTNVECKLFESFGPATQKFEFIRERSFLQSSLAKLRQILDGRALDLLFIDGDHSYAAVKSDYEMYHPFVAADGMIAFHDIVEIPKQFEAWSRGNEVAIFWRELSPRIEGREFIDSDFAPEKSGTPVSRIWPPLGIGVVLGR
jgi:predicted O-methyltransferase YrrM